MTNQAFEIIQKKLKKVATYRQILYKPINGLLSFIEFGPIYRSDLENGRRFPHIRWIPVNATDNNKRSGNKQAGIGCKYLSWNNFPRIKLIRGKMFQDRYLLLVTTYLFQKHLLFSVALVVSG